MGYRLIKNLEGEYNRKLFQGDNNYLEDFPPITDHSSISIGSELEMLTGEKYKLNSLYQWQLLPSEGGGGGGGGGGIPDVSSIPINTSYVRGSDFSWKKLVSPGPNLIQQQSDGGVWAPDVSTQPRNALKKDTTGNLYVPGISNSSDNMLIEDVNGLYVPQAILDVSLPPEVSGTKANNVVSIPMASTTTGGFLSKEIYQTLFAAPEHRVYVDSNYTGTNILGTESEPYKSISAAIQAYRSATGPVVFIIKAGSVFNEASYTIPSGMPPVRFIAQDSAVKSPSATWGVFSSNSIVRIASTNLVVISGFFIHNVMVDAVGAYYFDNCEITTVDTAIGTSIFITNSNLHQVGLVFGSSSAYLTSCSFINSIYGQPTLEVNQTSTLVAIGCNNISGLNNSGIFYCQDSSLYAYTAYAGSTSFLVSGTTQDLNGIYENITIQSGANYSIGNSFDYTGNGISSGAIKINNNQLELQRSLRNRDNSAALPGGTPMYSKTEVDALIQSSGTIGVYTYGSVTTLPPFPTVTAKTTLFDFIANTLYTYTPGTGWDSGVVKSPLESSRIDILSWLNGTSATGVDMASKDGFAIYFESEWKYFCDIMGGNTITFNDTIETDTNGEVGVAPIQAASITEDTDKFTSGAGVSIPYKTFVQNVLNKINGTIDELDDKYELPSGGIPTTSLANGGTGTERYVLTSKGDSGTPTYETQYLEITSFEADYLRNLISATTTFPVDIYWGITTQGAPTADKGFGTILRDSSIVTITAYTLSGEYKFNDDLNNFTVPTWVFTDGSDRLKVVDLSTVNLSVTMTDNEVNDLTNAYFYNNRQVDLTGSSMVNLVNFIGSGALQINLSSYEGEYLTLNNAHTVVFNGNGVYSFDEVHINNDSVAHLDGPVINTLLSIDKSLVTLSGSGDIGEVFVANGGKLVIKTNYTGTITTITNESGIVLDERVGSYLDSFAHAKTVNISIGLSTFDEFFAYCTPNTTTVIYSQIGYFLDVKSVINLPMDNSQEEALCIVVKRSPIGYVIDVDVYGPVHLHFVQVVNNFTAPTLAGWSQIIPMFANDQTDAEALSALYPTTLVFFPD